MEPSVLSAWNPEQAEMECTVRFDVAIAERSLTPVTAKELTRNFRRALQGLEHEEVRTVVSLFYQHLDFVEDELNEEGELEVVLSSSWRAASPSSRSDKEAQGELEVCGAMSKCRSVRESYPKRSRRPRDTS